jgi:hypothetical protein
MIISEKQHAANCQNAQHSCGPVTPEGKAAVRLNAVTYGLRAHSILITGEDPEQYQRLWADLEAEWHPQTCTERMYLEQMSTSQWLLARIARGENSIYESRMPAGDQFPLLREVASQRTRLERSFVNAMRELKQLQKERQARQSHPIETTRTTQTAKAAPAPAAEPAAPPPAYVMSDAPEAHPDLCAPAATDSR